MYISEIHDAHKLISVNILLLQILMFFRTVTGDINMFIQLQFDDGDAINCRYKYQTKVTEDAWANVLIPEDIFDSSCSTLSDYEAYSDYLLILQHLLKRCN